MTSAPTPPPLVTLEEVSFRYGEGEAPVLRNLSLDVTAGETILVAGPSGCGKSTLLRLMNGLVPHFHGGVLEGRIRVADRDPVAEGPRGMSAEVGFVFQDPELQFVAERVEDEVAFALENQGIDPPALDIALAEVLASLQLEGLRRRPLTTLSGGERQRVAVAGVLVANPRLLVLDEPTSQLDAASAEELFHHLGRLRRRADLTVLVSEHRLERVAPWAHRVCLMGPEAGDVIVGPTREVLAASPLAPPVTRLGHALGWAPPPLSIEEAAPLAREAGLTQPSSSTAFGTKARVEDEIEPEVPRHPASSPPMLTVENLAYQHDAKSTEATPWTLSVPRLELRAGDRLAIMGPSGSGKSTLLKLLVGLLSPSAGRVLIDGEDTAELELLAITRRVGFVPQNPGRLLFQESLAEEVRFTRDSHRLPPAPDVDGAPWPLARLGLADLAGRHPLDLSTGERQRAALAAILAAEPAALLLDEPTRGLDGPRKGELICWLAELAAEGVAVVLVTHDVELVARWAERLVVLEDGRPVTEGPLADALAASEADRLGLRPQMLRLLGDPGLLTESEVLAALAPEAAR